MQIIHKKKKVVDNVFFVCNHLNMQLADRYYTSTEVAEILGVSLRSVYRYLEEDKIKADIKTATGRHRFTRQNILDFLYPEGEVPAQVIASKEEKFEPVKSAPVQQPVTYDPVVDDTFSSESTGDEDLDADVFDNVTEDEVEEEVDWLAKFKEAAAKHKEAAAVGVAAQAPAQNVEPQVQEQSDSLGSLVDTPKQPAPEPAPLPGIYYYRSSVGGLRELAQYVHSAASKSNVPYAFTMNAGMSLHKLIRPFSILHVYVRSTDKAFFERALELTPTDEGSAQLCLFVNDSSMLYDSSKEMHGLWVVSDIQLRRDLLEHGESELAGELDEVVNPAI